ncbi:MAG: histidine phosphatase family protein [Clostridia bacterium]
MKIFLIRHGETFGNSLKRYIGKTDEHLSDKGVAFLKTQQKIAVDRAYISPLLRCVETAEILIEAPSIAFVGDLRECDFGDFENKNYLDLNGNMDYQSWIDSNGKTPFPNGECLDDFKIRCVKAFEKCVELEINQGDAEKKSIAFVVHNGTIMSIMEHLFGEYYFDYSVENGKGYVLNLKNGEYIWKKL